MMGQCVNFNANDPMDDGKEFDKTGPFGPVLVTPDELPAAAKGLKIECRLNGKTVQSSSTDMMIFPVVETLVYITQAFTLSRETQ